MVIREMLDEIWKYNSWVEPMSTLLNSWTPEQADRPLPKGIPSVTQIVNHTAFWGEVAARRLAGRSLDDLMTQFDDAHDGLAPSSMPRWPQAAENYRKQRSAVVAALEQLSDDELTRPVPGEDFTLIWPAVGRAIHDTYHGGQLALLYEMTGHELPSASAETAAPAASIKSGAKALFKEFLLELMHNSWAGTMWLHPAEKVLADVSPALANWRVSESVHTMTEIVYHMAFWEEYVTRHLRGESTGDMPRAEQANGPGREPSGMPDWSEVREGLFTQHRALRKTLTALKEGDLFTVRDQMPAAYTPMYRLVSGVIIHDSYHLGQLVLLQQMLRHKGR
ncbi:MAG: hypothetical protein A2Z21_10330 [Candidatus Fraserbacteria bacterium RBG_16_55_9]|uniref:DinB-like domain-containing protein n=1 Tax=Fraserbacteria sp. (strain RBG_16_55_9) TaxID=1817864 RepID=A0A1F5URP5_FRAXR|nr:MAG: hypothetical protein A2Z21_10330 [Candidatus Fraserbacteria bacterium RBG_16_55_9]